MFWPSTAPAWRRHLETHRAHLIDVTGERPLITATLIAEATNTGTASWVRERLERLEEAGVGGVLYGPQGADIPRELESFAAVAGIEAVR